LWNINIRNLTPAMGFRYRPGGLDSFNRRYLSEWEDRLMNIPKGRMDRKSEDR
jgi:hypothetical protein